MTQGKRFSEQKRVASDYSHNEFWGKRSIWRWAVPTSLKSY